MGALRCYAGIGSRETPEPILEIMTKIARVCRKEGYTLRSGGANGADSAFEAGAGVDKEIYLPWRGFNNNSSTLYNLSDEAYKLAEQFHPAWHKCSVTAKKFHARNCYQVLGYDLKTPAYFVVCWTPNGLGSGGTGQAIRIANHYKIPVYDLGDFEQFLVFNVAFPWGDELKDD